MAFHNVFTSFDPTNKNSAVRRGVANLTDNPKTTLTGLALGGPVTGLLLPSAKDTVENFVGELTGENAQRDATAALTRANEQARGVLADSAEQQQNILFQQQGLFDQNRGEIQGRFDDFTGRSQQQFDQNQAGIQSRFDLVQQQLEPFLAAGQRSVGSLEDLVNNPNQIAQTDAFQFRFNQGQQAVENSAAARGSGLGGNVLLALQQQGQGLASEELQNEFIRRQQLVANGQSSVGQLISAIGQTGNESTNAFNQLSNQTGNAFNQVGSQNTGAFNQFSGAINQFSQADLGIKNAVANTFVNQGNAEAAGILGQQQNNISNILGLAQIGVGLATANPAPVVSGVSQVATKPQPFTGVAQQSPRINPTPNPLDAFLQNAPPPLPPPFTPVGTNTQFG